MTYNTAAVMVGLPRYVLVVATRSHHIRSHPPNSNEMNQLPQGHYPTLPSIYTPEIFSFREWLETMAAPPPVGKGGKVAARASRYFLTDWYELKIHNAPVVHAYDCQPKISQGEEGDKKLQGP